MLPKPIPEPQAPAATQPAERLDLNLLMLFLDIVNSGSISQTAARLHVPKATLSRKLRALEQQIGAVVLKRGPHRLEVTEVGRALLQRCERIAAEVEDASLVASEMQSKLSGTMRISIPFGLSNTWISRALARFALRYPDVKLTVHVTNRWVDVSEEPYDVAIHIGKIRNENLPIRRLVELPRGFYASPSYCQREGVPQSPEDLLHHDCIPLESQLTDGLWTFGAADRGQINPRMITTDIMVAREMAICGLGVAILTHAVSESDMAAGRLVRVLPAWEIPPVVVAAMFLERRHMPVRIRAFIDLMAQALRDDPPGPGSQLS
jgi:DNA-binding transcriptional LysR family regulator